MKSELYGSPLDKWGNGANLMGQIWDSDLSGSAFQSPCSCQQYPGWGHWASSTVTGIYDTQTHPPPDPTPVHDYFLLKTKSKSLPSPFHRAGVGNGISLGAVTQWPEQVWAAASPYTPCPPPFLGPLSQAQWGRLLRHRSENRAPTWIPWCSARSEYSQNIKDRIKGHTETTSKVQWSEVGQSNIRI